MFATALTVGEDAGFIYSFLPLWRGEVEREGCSRIEEGGPVRVCLVQPSTDDKRESSLRVESNRGFPSHSAILKLSVMILPSGSSMVGTVVSVQDHQSSLL